MKRWLATYGIDLEYALTICYPRYGNGRLRKLNDVSQGYAFWLYWGLFASIMGVMVLFKSPVLLTIFGLLFSLFYLPVLMFRSTVARKSTIYKKVKQEILTQQGIKEK